MPFGNRCLVLPLQSFLVVVQAFKKAISIVIASIILILENFIINSNFVQI